MYGGYDLNTVLGDLLMYSVSDNRWVRLGGGGGVDVAVGGSARWQAAAVVQSGSVVDQPTFVLNASGQAGDITEGQVAEESSQPM